MNQVMRLGWVLALGLLATGGCDVSVGSCDKDDAGECVDLFPDDEDGGFQGMDAATDAARPPDASSSDSSVLTDASVFGDAGLDASTPLDAALPATLTPQQFCDAQLSVARAWLDKFSTVSCDCLSNDDIEGYTAFLGAALRFTDGSGAACLDNVTRTSDAGAAAVRYEPTKAAACASRYASQFKGPADFAAPIASCPGGFDIGVLEGAIGHGAQNLPLLAECRAAFVGSKAANTACADSLECQSGLRCIEIPGGGSRTCQPARGRDASCVNQSDCSDGHVCSLNIEASGGSAAAYTCIPVTMLKDIGGLCRFSFECSDGLVCRDSRCAATQADLICD